MANKRLYDEKTGEGWAKVAGKWHYFRDGKILDLPPIPGLHDADQRLKTWRDTTKKKVKKAVEPHAEQVGKGFLLAGKSIQDTSKQVGKGFQIAAKGAQDASKKYVYDPVNKVPGLWKDLGDRTIGSGEFNDKGRELSVFELRRQKEKYQEQEKLKNLSMWNVSPESLDIEIEPLELDFSNIPFDPNSDFGKTWGIDTSDFDTTTNLYYQNAFKSADILNKLDGANSSVFETNRKAEEEKKKLSVANLKNADPTVLGGKPDELDIQKELGKNLRKTNFGGTDPGQSLWLGKNSTWTMGGKVVAPKVGTTQAEAMMNIPDTPEPPDTTIAKEFVSDPVDPVEVDKGLGVQDTSKLVDKSVKVDPVTSSSAAVPATTPTTGANPLPEGFFSGLIDFLNNRGGGK